MLVGVSGGVDSTIVAALMHQAIGKRSKAILIDHGMMRFNEAESCAKALKYGLGVNIQLFDESKKFLIRLTQIFYSQTLTFQYRNLKEIHYKYLLSVKF